MSSTPPPAPGYHGVAVAPTNSLAIVSLVLSAVGLFTFVTAIAGVICGHLALGQIARTGESGRGLALAGVIGGYVVIGLYLLIILGATLLVVWGVGLVSTLAQQT